MSQLILETVDNILYQRLLVLLSTADIMENGMVLETKHLVRNIRGINIYINSNEHSPPHFHAKYAEYEAGFSIKNCKLLFGNIPRRELKIIKYWHSAYKVNKRLTEMWNETRPTDCQIGKA